MKDDLLKKIKLGDELDNSIKQLVMALNELQTTVNESSYYFVTFQLLANGFERLLKVAICYGHLHTHDTFPTLKKIKTHDINELLSIFMRDYFSDRVPALQIDQNYIFNDLELQIVISILTEFGKFARYHNLNVVTGDVNAVDVQDIWKKLETDFVMGNPELKNLLFDKPDYDFLDKIISDHFVSIIEKFTRAIVRQFTLGYLGSEPGRNIGFYSHFLYLQDDQIGKTDYQEKFFHKKIKPQKVYKKTRNKRLSLSKEDINDLWPFKNSDSVVVEKSKDNCIYLIINKKIYALNGLTAQKYNLPFAHDYGEAYKGRSVSEFTKIAQAL